MAEGYGEAGRRLYAAMISYRLGLKSVDYTLKNYVAAEVHPSWAELAEALDRAMSESVDKAKIPRAVTDKIQ